MVASDLYALLAVLLILLESLGKVSLCAIFYTPLQLLLGGLLGDAEACQLALHTRQTHCQ